MSIPGLAWGARSPRACKIFKAISHFVEAKKKRKEAEI